MALWQFDFNIVPSGRCAIVENLSIEDILSWKQEDISSVEINFLEKETSWTKDIVQYGKEDETCIQFLYEDEILEEISCRLDLRSLSKKMLKEILEYVEKIGGMIFLEGKIYSPTPEEIIELMKNSKANKSCQNSIDYFEELDLKSCLMVEFY